MPVKAESSLGDATLRWHRDVEDNSVAIATFDSLATQLVIENEVII
jgi:hypothetical protein